MKARLKILGLLWVLLMTHPAVSQSVRPSLDELSQKVNKTLPDIYDHATKLISTTVENNNFIYHFVLKATQEEFDYALPKVKAQILKTICSKSREKSILKDYKANIVYKYESVKGSSLGQFMVKPEKCK